MGLYIGDNHLSRSSGADPQYTPSSWMDRRLTSPLAALVRSKFVNTVLTWMTCVGLFVLLPTGEARADGISQDIAKQIEQIHDKLNSSPATDRYRIYALRIGLTHRARRGLFIADPALPKYVSVAFSFWVLKGTERIILIDTGFSNLGMVDRWQIEDYKDPITALKEIGIDPDQVTDVIVTHSHWDHIGSLHKFHRACLWMSKHDVRAILRDKQGRLPSAVRLAKREGRLKVTEHITRVAPSVVTVPVGLHTPGHQFVVVKRGDRAHVFSSDIAPLWANFERKKTTGQTSNRLKTQEIQEMILQLAGRNIKNIIPGHEPGIYVNGPIKEIHTLE